MFFILIIDMNNILAEFGERKLFFIKSLSVYSGEKIGIVGENGAGKTTLLNIITGKTRPTAGTVDRNGSFSYITQNVTDVPMGGDLGEKHQWQVPDMPKSGGELMRAKIADALAKDGDLLVCDEPTSNLDEQGIRRLETALAGCRNTVLLVSHDRALMDKICTGIWEIRDGSVRTFRGNYSAFKEQQEKERQNQKREYEKYVQTKKSLEQALLDRSSKAQSMTRTPKRMGNSEARLHRMDVRQKAGKVSAAAKNIRNRIDSLEVKEKVRDETNYRIVAESESQKAGKCAVVVENLSFSYGQKPILKNVSFYVERKERVCIAGDNGSGKSTLLNCIAWGNDGVRMGPKDTIGYFDQNCLGLDGDKSILAFVMQTSRLSESLTRTTLAELGIKREDVHKEIRVLSGGERNKTALAALICRQCSVLILDEPTNYMDVYMMEALENLLVGYDGTIIFVSHDRRFRQNVATRSLRLENGILRDAESLPPKEHADRKVSVMLLELRAAELIEKKRGRTEAQQAEMEREYVRIMAEVNRLKNQD